LPDVQLTWLGHAAFRFDTPGGKRVYVDPFLSGNPKTPDDEKEPERVDAIAITHAHGDHVGDTVEIWKRHKPSIVAIVELKGWLADQGAADETVMGSNKGGTVEAAGVKFTMVNAYHSGGLPDGGYGGEAAGFVVEVENGTKIYFAGDTCVFGDMQLIGRIYEPDLAVLPVGDHFTMGPKEAAVALELLGVKRCLPCHYGTFPLLHGTPDELQRLAPDIEFLTPEPGQTVTV
jgi:L-ascorbate metabolism protein UlaG (beta-lactamase superfamily)